MGHPAGNNSQLPPERDANHPLFGVFGHGWLTEYSNHPSLTPQWGTQGIVLRISGIESHPRRAEARAVWTQGG